MFENWNFPSLSVRVEVRSTESLARRRFTDAFARLIFSVVSSTCPLSWIADCANVGFVNRHKTQTPNKCRIIDLSK